METQFLSISLPLNQSKDSLAGTWFSNLKRGLRVFIITETGVLENSSVPEIKAISNRAKPV